MSIKIDPPEGFSRIYLPDRVLTKLYRDLSKAGFAVRAYWSIDEDEVRPGEKVMYPVLEASRKTSVDEGELEEHVMYSTDLGSVLVSVTLRDRFRNTLDYKEAEADPRNYINVLRKLRNEVLSLDRERLESIRRELKGVTDKLSKLGFTLDKSYLRFGYVAMHDKMGIIVEYRSGKGFTLIYETTQPIDGSILGIEGKIEKLVVTDLSYEDLIRLISRLRGG